MKKVAKLVIIDSDDKYLLMHRSDHPTFGVDPDLPGGTLEDDETMLVSTSNFLQHSVYSFCA